MKIKSIISLLSVVAVSLSCCNNFASAREITNGIPTPDFSDDSECVATQTFENIPYNEVYAQAQANLVNFNATDFSVNLAAPQRGRTRNNNDQNATQVTVSYIVNYYRLV